MIQLTAYLKFNNQCREAFEFYQGCFGGELDLQTVGSSPAAEHMPAESHDKIMHGSLANDSLKLFGSDMIRHDNHKVGNSVALCITGDNKEVKTVFAKLAAGGEVTDELTETYFGTYGALIDKFGVSWMFQSDPVDKTT